MKTLTLISIIIALLLTFLVPIQQNKETEGRGEVSPASCTTGSYPWDCGHRA